MLEKMNIVGCTMHRNTEYTYILIVYFPASANPQSILPRAGLEGSFVIFE
jgi:hypothetical protein